MQESSYKLKKSLKISDFYFTFLQIIYIIYRYRNKKENIMLEFYITIAIAIVFSALFIVMWKPNTFLVNFSLKGLATISVIGVALTVILNNGFDTISLMLMIGLIFCLFGDLLLCLRTFPLENYESKITTLGTASFGIAQILFVACLAMCSGLVSLYGLIFGAVFAVGLYLLKGKMGLNFGSCLIPSLIYGALLASNVGGSIIWLIVSGGILPSILASVGFALFIASDLVLSKIYFGGNKSIFTQKINFVLYYLAILVLASMFI